MLNLRRVTMSKLEALEACPASAVLPLWGRASGPEAQRGRHIHKYIELVLSGVDVRSDEMQEFFAEIGEELTDFCRHLDLNGFLGGNVMSEVAFALDVGTLVGRELGKRMDRDYWDAGATPSDLCGSADIVEIREGYVYVGDFKTGRSEVTPPARNLQLGALALAATTAYDVDRAVVEILHVDEEGEIRPRRASLGPRELDGVARRIVALLVAIEACPDQPKHGDDTSGFEPFVKLGKQCTYCQCVPYCPAQQAFVQMAVTGGLPGPTDPKDIAAVYRAAKGLEAASKAMLQTAYAYASQFLVELGNGLVLGPVRKERRTLDARIVHEVVSQQISTGMADECVKLTSSQEALKRVIAKVADKGKKAEMTRKIVAEVEARGGVTRTVSESIEPHERQLDGKEEIT